MGRGGISYEKIKQMNKCLSVGMTNTQIMQEMKISKNTLTSYKDKIDEEMWNYVLGRADYGLLMDFREHYEQVSKRTEQYDQLIKTAMAGKNDWFKLHVLQAADAHNELVIKLMNDAKIVREFKKLFAKRSSEGTENKEQ